MQDFILLLHTAPAPDIASGNSDSNNTATFAGTEITSSACPRLHARTTCRAAFSALTVSNGNSCSVWNPTCFITIDGPTRM